MRYPTRGRRQAQRPGPHADPSGPDAEQSIAFGDGGNDVTMLEYAGIGVAMGNACDAAKAAADYVTDDITADGLAKALAHFGLI